MNKYLVAGTKSWNKRHFEEKTRNLPGEWHYVGDAEELTAARVAALKPRYVFFLHWSRKVPAEILRDTECVCFHMTDVPYGRGGSPLQNLIVRGHAQTRLTALQMSEEFDAGPVYLKRDLSLAGTAEEIYVRASALSFEMLEEIVNTEPKPIAQSGEPVIFKRRTPEQSKITEISSLESLHDHIRMLDAEGYPKAYLEMGDYRFELSSSSLSHDRIVANVQITRKTEEKKS